MIKRTDEANPENRPDIRDGEICMIGKGETERLVIHIPDARYHNQMAICCQRHP